MQGGSRVVLALVTAVCGAAGTVAAGVVSAQTPPAAGSWTTLKASGLKRQEVAFTTAGGKMYLFGGTTTERQQVYDPVTDAWTETGAPAVDGKLDHVQSVAVGNRVYYIGGLTGWPKPDVGTVHIYDTSTGSWTTGDSMPPERQRGAGGVAVHNGKIYYAGGLHTEGDTTTAVRWFDEYDPATNDWRPLPDMPTARDHFHAVVLDGRLWAIGGRKGANAVQTPIGVNEAYDFAAGTWRSAGLAPLPTARGGFAAAAVGCEIFYIGGEGNGPIGGAFDAVEAYHPATNTWRTLADMPTARHGIQAAVHAGRIYVAAGGMQQYGGMPTDILERFDPGPQPKCGSSSGGPGTGQPSAPGGPATDTSRPRITLLDLSRQTFRSRRGRGRYGTRLRLRVSEPATLHLRVSRLRRQRPPRTMPGALRWSVDAGTARLTFTGRLRNGRRLGPGRYRLSIVAIDAAGNASRAARVRFRVIR